MEDKLLYRDEVYAIQGALFDVYKTMGNMWGEGKGRSPTNQSANRSMVTRG